MKKIVRLTESDINRIVKKVIKESMWTSTPTWGNLNNKSSNTQKKNLVYNAFMKELAHVDADLGRMTSNQLERFRESLMTDEGRRSGNFYYEMLGFLENVNRRLDDQRLNREEYEEITDELMRIVNKFELGEDFFYEIIGHFTYGKNS